MSNKKTFFTDYGNISPLDTRYAVSNPELFKALSNILSENASVSFEVEVEKVITQQFIKHLYKKTHSAKEIANFTKQIDDAAHKVDPEQVYTEERETKHHMRAVVRVFSQYLPDDISRFVHLGLTSSDVLDTAHSLRIKKLMTDCIIPSLIRVCRKLLDRAKEEIETFQIGRTHGQFAIPITAGYFFASYASRLSISIQELIEKTNNLKGKLSGAVGGFHALGIIIPNPKEFEKETLAQLGLSPCEISTQIVQPEFLIRLRSELQLAIGIIADLADDLRHLSRSEIGEFSETFSRDQVGSSTMPQKRNPWNCEHIKSLWKVATPQLLTAFFDQLSEHQRDLTNSASTRFSLEWYAVIMQASERISHILTGLSVHRERMQENLNQANDSILAEPVYILLSVSGVKNAYEYVRGMVQESKRINAPLKEILASKKELVSACSAHIKTLGFDTIDQFFAIPANYHGRCVEITAAVCSAVQERLPIDKVSE